MRGLAILLMLSAPIAVCAGESVSGLPPASPTPGGIAIVDLGPADQTEPAAAFLGEQRVMVTSANGRRYAVVGIALDTEPGPLVLRVDTGGVESTVPFEIVARDYESQHITVSNPRQVDPNPDDLARIGAEKKRIDAALANWRDVPAPLRLQLPVEGRRSSAFGLRRYFNDKPRRPHSGIDIAADTGTQIRAAADGLVSETGNYFFNGNTVFVDHGQGLVTMYCHMNAITVEAGASVAAGEVIGTVGSTGRVTGPHLHWSVSLNRAMIDPDLLLGTGTEAGTPEPPADTARQ